jgi:hypothetical protein
MIVGSTVLISLCGWLTIGTLEHYCKSLPQSECRLLIITATLSMLGGFLFLEILIARKKERGEWTVRPRDLHSDGPVLSPSQVWLRSIARVVLASLLVGLPVILKGALGLAIFGALTGLSLDLLVRGVMGWLPPIENDKS